LILAVALGKTQQERPKFAKGGIVRIERDRSYRELAASDYALLLKLIERSLDGRDSGPKVSANLRRIGLLEDGDQHE
jgi:hypothetical protein